MTVDLCMSLYAHTRFDDLDLNLNFENYCKPRSSCYVSYCPSIRIGFSSVAHTPLVSRLTSNRIQDPVCTAALSTRIDEGSLVANSICSVLEDSTWAALADIYIYLSSPGIVSRSLWVGDLCVFPAGSISGPLVAVLEDSQRCIYNV